MKRVLAAFLVVFALTIPHADAANGARTSAQPIDTSSANAALTFDLFNNETLMGVEITGLGASGATLTIEGSTDGRKDSSDSKVWFSTVAIPFTCPSPSTFTTVNSDGPFKFDTSGLTNVRFRVSSTGTGTALISINAIPASTLGSCGGTGGGGGGGGNVNIHDSAGNNLTSAGGALNVAGTFSATLGGFTPSSSGFRMAPLTVQLTDSSQTLPTGAVTVVDNTDTTNPIFCNVNGVAATTSDKKIPANSWFAFTIPATITALHCIATGAPVIANGVGGAGLATGAGGGGGSGGGGTFTWPGTAGVAAGGTSAGSNTMPYVNNYQVNSIPVGANAIGSITNTSFGISGTLPAFAATPTVNLGTIAGAATAANQEVTAAGTSATSAQGVQGVTGGIAMPMSVAALPLPTGAATSALQTTGNTSLATIATNTATTAAGTTAASAQAVQGVTGGIALPVSAAFLPLPSGAATATNQEVTAAGTSATSAQGVQGVTGGIAMPTSVASLPLPTGAATAANQEVTAAGTSATSAQGVQGVTGGIHFLSNLFDGTGNAITSTAGALNVAGSFSATTLAFLPGGTPITPFTATGSSTTTSIPGGSTTLIVSSSSATGNILHCTIGAGPAVVSDQTIQPGVSFAFNATGATQFSCITSAGSQIVTAVAGSGTLQGVSGGGSASANASVSATGSAVPASATYLGMLVGGNLTGVPGTANGLGVQQATAANLNATVVQTTAANLNATTTDSGIKITGSTLGAGGSGLVGWDSQISNQITNGTDSANNAKTATAVNVTGTDCSGTATTGGTAQTAISTQTTLHGFTLANTDASAGSGEPIWISFTTTAAAGAAASYPIAPPTATTFAGMGSYTSPPGFGTGHAVSILAATTGHKFSCTWW